MDSPRRQLVAALALHFLSVASIVLCRTLIDLIFLTTYPRSWLPYLFMGQTGVVILLAFGIGPLVAKGSVALNVGLLGSFAASLAAGRVVLGHQVPGAAFILCLWLAVQAVLLGVISWSAVGDAFDVRQFKKLAKWINASGSVGALVLGSLIPVIVAVFAPESMLYLVGGMMLTAASCLLFLRPISAGGSRANARGIRSPLGYPLFLQLALGAFLMTLMDTFADYSLKSELAAVYDKKGIGQFMGPFYGISSVLTLVIQFSATGVLLKHFGITGLLGPMPIFCALAGAAITIRPGLWTAAILRMGQNVAAYSINNLGREIAARPLPGAIRRAGKVYLKGIATPLGTGLGAVFLWLAAEHVLLRGVAIAAVVVCVVWFLITTRTSRAYQGALEEAVGSGRLSMALDEVSETTLQAGRSVAQHALQSKEQDVVLFGLQLLQEVGHGEMPPAALEHLDSEAPSIRAAAARAAISFEADSTVPSLLDRLDRETEPSVTWRLLETLADVAPVAAVEATGRLIDSPHPNVRAGAVLVLLAAGDLDGIIQAATTLKQMITSGQPEMRRGAARAIGALRAGRLENELRFLLDDPDEQVCITAIRAVGDRRAEALADKVAERLGVGKTSYYASHALLELGEAAIRALVQVIREGSPGAQRAAVRTLALMDDTRVDRILLDLIPEVDVATRTVISRQTARRARRRPVSEEHCSRMLELVHEEARSVRLLGDAARSSDLSSGVIAELRERQRLARDRLLHWMAACSKPGEVLDLIPALVSSNMTKDASARRSAAMELLDTLVGKRLRSYLGALEQKKGGMAIDAVPLDHLKDPWIQWLVTSQANSTVKQGEPMDVAQRVMLLRKVDLFDSLPGETLVAIAENCEEREFAAGQQVFCAGDPPDGLYVIAAGSVSIRKGSKVLADLAPSEVFGEVALLDDDPRMADAVANNDGKALFIDREVFQQIAEDMPDVLRAVIRTLIGYLKHADAAHGTTTIF